MCVCSSVCPFVCLLCPSSCHCVHQSAIVSIVPLFCPSMLSVCASTCPSVHPFLLMPVCLSLSISLLCPSMCVRPSVQASAPLSVHGLSSSDCPYIHLSVFAHFCARLFIHLALYLSVCPCRVSVHLSCPSVYVSVLLCRLSILCVCVPMCLLDDSWPLCPGEVSVQGDSSEGPFSCRGQTGCI